MERSVEKFLIVIEREYKALFKAGIALLAVVLLGLSDTFPTLIEYDFETKKQMFLVLEQAKMHDIDNVECDSLHNNIARCNFVKYRLSADHRAINLASVIIVFLFWVGCFLLSLSVMGFVLSLAHEQSRT